MASPDTATETGRHGRVRVLDPLSSVVTWLPADRIVAGPNDRTYFDPEKLAALAASIDADGLIMPPTVRPFGDVFEIVAGERRTRAMRDVLRCAEIPVLVSTMSDDSASVTMLVENLAPDALPPMSEAAAFGTRRDRDGWSAAETARHAGVPAARVRDRLRLLELGAEVGHWIERGDLPICYGQAMVGLDSNRQHLALEAFAGENRPGIDVFRRVCAKLLDDQGADSIFDADAFLVAEEVVISEITAETETPVATSVREKLLGCEQIADACEVARETPVQWRRRGLLPAPDMIVGGQHFWWATTIRDWCWQTGRKFDCVPWMDVRQDVSLG